MTSNSPGSLLGSRRNESTRPPRRSDQRSRLAQPASGASSDSVFGGACPSSLDSSRWPAQRPCTGTFRFTPIT